MPLKLNDLQWADGAKHRIKRVGRGTSSGHGKTSGRGHKGQNSRTGGGTRAGFEGGQMPLFRRIPKRGFRNAPFRRTYAVIHVGQLETLGTAQVDIPMLHKMLVSNTRRPIKLLGDGSLTRSLAVQVHQCSASARQKVEQAGGKVTLIPWRS